MIRVVNVAEVTTAVARLLDEHPEIGRDGVIVERSEVWDTTPTEKGWVGVYRERQSLPTRALGMGAGFREQRISLIILVRESDYSSGAACEERLDALIQKVMSALLTDHSLGGTVDTLADELDVRYDKYEKTPAGIWVQSAVIFITGIVRVSAF